MPVHASSAVTSSSMMCPEHIATRRVEIGLPPMNCAREPETAQHVCRPAEGPGFGEPSVLR
jgi:hypothetical protein